MTLPGFDAEASLYMSNAQYRGAKARNLTGKTVYPAWSNECPVDLGCYPDPDPLSSLYDCQVCSTMYCDGRIVESRVCPIEPPATPIPRFLNF